MAQPWDSGVPLCTLGLYLLGTLLLPGVVEPQATNYTEDLFRLSNQTVPPTTNGISTIPNVTESEWTTVDSNMTVITEDDEGFQDWEDELRLGQCMKEQLRELCSFCGEDFYSSMRNVKEDEWCSLKEILWPYHEMALCLEKLSMSFGCFYPNPIIQGFFLEVHSDFFRNCSNTTPHHEDAPHGVVLTLTLIPVSLIPALVYTVIWKNKAHN